MDEYLDILTKDGQPTGKTALKSEAHKKGWFHNTIHLWLYTKDGRILLQQRSHLKLIFPLLWDVSVGGHINAGESIIDAVVRETKEELGLTLQPGDLQKIGTHKHMSSYANNTILDNEFHQVFISELKEPIQKLIPQKSEVEDLKLVNFKTFKELLKHSETNNHFIPTNKAYYIFIIDKILKTL